MSGALTEEKRKAIQVMAHRMLQPLAAAIESLKNIVRRQTPNMPPDEFERQFNMALNLALMQMMVSKSMELGLEVAQVHGNIDALFQHTQSVLSQQKPRKGG